MLIYLDSSAAIKLVSDEAHSSSLREWLMLHPKATLVSSSLIHVELHRAVRRIEHALNGSVTEVLQSVNQVAMSHHILERAGSLPDAELRSLDAIHLATALVVASLTNSSEFVLASYDQRLNLAAERAGLTAIQPGLTTH